MSPTSTRAADTMFGLLMPMSQLVIGLLVVVAVVVSVHKLFMRGPSRMGGAMLLTGGAVVVVAVIGWVSNQF